MKKPDQTVNTVNKDTISQMLRRSWTVALMILATGILVIGTPLKAESLGFFGDWAAFHIKENGNDTCYIGSVPSKMEGNYTARGDSFLMVTQRPAIEEFNVVSVRAGYKYKENSEVIATIDDTAFVMFGLNTMAWARDAESDRALVTAMRKGHELVLSGQSWRGTQTTDTYSLKGFTRAYKKSLESCDIK